ncbi:MAG TPA: penicillin acylase family protein [Ohtaekwangia sp.]
MKILKRIGMGLLLLIIILAVALIVFLYRQKPTYSGEKTLEGLQNEVEVLYDTYGVPHIYAQHAEDAYFALGYVHAQDRLFQMEMLRRAADGRLAEILGPDLVKVDRLFRTLGLNHFAEENAQRYLSGDSTEFQRAIHAYQKGVNAFVKNGKTPVEFSIIGIPKMEFTPKDIYLAIAFMSFGFAEGLQADPVLEKIRTELGTDYLNDLAVQTPPEAVRIKNFNGTPKEASTDTLIAFVRSALDKLPVPLWQGSNGWVMSGDRTASGAPILANDTHIGFSQPAAWYEAHIEYPGFSFYGHHLAGIPFGLLGNNRFCGVGLTMFENDDTDFYYETLNPENPNQVKFKDQWEDLKVRQEIIKVKGGEDVVLEIKTSRHGPIVNGGIETVSDSLQPVALWWVLNSQPNEALQAAYLMNHATSFPEIRKAASMFSAPGLNLMYGDTEGNIAWWAVAKLPVRPKHVVSKLFLDGASGNDEYEGFYPFEKNPHAVNPPWGFVYTTNNQPDSVDGVLYAGYYYPKDRAQRVSELLEENKKWTVDDMKKINLDVLSHSHREVAQEIVPILKSMNKPEFADFISILEKWDGNHLQTDNAPSVYYNLLSQIMFLSMKDELGYTAFKSIMETSIPKNSYRRFIANTNSPWWDNIKTPEQKETREQIVEKAAANTLSLLRETCGDEPSEWTWGKIHTLTHNHPLGTVKPLDRFFSVGPYPVNGGSEVLNNLSPPLDTTGFFPVQSGPALRKITDFSDIDHGETVSPTGQSGNIMSKYYSDEAEMFVNGEFRKMLMNRKEIEAASKNRLILKRP